MKYILLISLFFSIFTQAQKSSSYDNNQEDLGFIAYQEDNAYTQYQIGSMFFYGTNELKKDVEQAFYWFSVSADQNFSPGQYMLALLYYTDKFYKNDVLARYWFEQAAKKDYAEAQYLLGKMYKLGHGGPKDLFQTYYWWMKAARQNHQKSQKALKNL